MPKAKRDEPIANSQRDDFHWVFTDEPHATRRKLVLKAHPEIKQLFGYDPNTKYVVGCVTVLQILLCVLLRDASFLSIFLLASTIGGAINHFLSLSIHEITHNLAFEKPIHNRLFSIFVPNLPLGLPSAVTFQKYHMEHHLFQGVDGVDMDIPSRGEGRFIRGRAAKLIWVVLQPYFYLLRPLFLRPKPLGAWELLNILVEVAFDLLILRFLGPRSLLFLVASTILGMGLHPVAGHFISEHYVFSPPHETYSYYGPLNFVTLNVGYHNEHHDFPRIPGSRLPRVRELAPEFYGELPHCTSWVMVIWNYIMLPVIGPFSRVKREGLESDNSKKDERDLTKSE